MVHTLNTDQTNGHTVSVVICTRDRPDDLVRCLESIEHQSIQPSCVVIVAGSDQSCPPGINDRFPEMQITVLESFEHNISIARNVGMANTQSDLVLFIDDDAIAHDGWIAAYITMFERDPSVTIMGGGALDSRTTPKVHEFHQGMLSPVGLQAAVISKPERIEELKRRGYLRTVKGCNFAVHRERVTQLGGFDPFFRFAFDEADLVFVVHEAHGAVVYCSGAVVDHAHTPGHYRQSGWMDHDWHVEYASHTMFMLKHTVHSNALRRMGWLIIWRRFTKLILRAAQSVVKRERTSRQAWKGVMDARDGIRQGRRTFYSRTDHRRPSSRVH